MNLLCFNLTAEPVINFRDYSFAETYFIIDPPEAPFQGEFDAMLWIQKKMKKTFPVIDIQHTKILIVIDDNPYNLGVAVMLMTFFSQMLVHVEFGSYLRGRYVNLEVFSANGMAWYINYQATMHETELRLQKGEK